MSTSIPEGRKPIDNVDIFRADLEADRAVHEGSDVSLTVEELNFLDQQPTSRASVRDQRGYMIDLVILVASSMTPVTDREEADREPLK